MKYERLNIVPIGVVDEDKSEYSEQLIQNVMKKDGVDITLHERGHAFKLLKANKLEAVVVIKKGMMEMIKNQEFEELIEFYKNPLSVSAEFIKESFGVNVVNFQIEALVKNEVQKQLKEEKLEFFKNDYVQYLEKRWGGDSKTFRIDYSEKGNGGIIERKEGRLPYIKGNAIGMITVFVMLFMLFNSNWYIQEKLNGTLIRLMSIEHGLIDVYIGNFITLYFIGSLQFLFFEFICRFVFDVKILDNFYSLLAVGAYLLCVISLSMLFAVALRRMSTLYGVVPVFTIITSFIGGCFWNFIQMDGFAAIFSKFTIQGWGLYAINNSLLHNLNEFFIASCVLFLLSSIFIKLSYSIMKKNMYNID